MYPSRYGRASESAKPTLELDSCRAGRRRARALQQIPLTTNNINNNNRHAPYKSRYSKNSRTAQSVAKEEEYESRVDESLSVSHYPSFFSSVASQYPSRYEAPAVLDGPDDDGDGDSSTGSGSGSVSLDGLTGDAWVQVYLPTAIELHNVGQRQAWWRTWRESLRQRRGLRKHFNAWQVQAGMTPASMHTNLKAFLNVKATHTHSTIDPSPSRPSHSSSFAQALRNKREEEEEAAMDAFAYKSQYHTLRHAYPDIHALAASERDTLLQLDSSTQHLMRDLPRDAAVKLLEAQADAVLSLKSESKQAVIWRVWRRRFAGVRKLHNIGNSIALSIAKRRLASFLLLWRGSTFYRQSARIQAFLAWKEHAVAMAAQRDVWHLLADRQRDRGMRVLRFRTWHNAWRKAQRMVKQRYFAAWRELQVHDQDKAVAHGNALLLKKVFAEWVFERRVKDTLHYFRGAILQKKAVRYTRYWWLYTRRQQLARKRDDESKTRRAVASWRAMVWRKRQAQARHASAVRFSATQRIRQWRQAVERRARLRVVCGVATDHFARTVLRGWHTFARQKTQHRQNERIADNFHAAYPPQHALYVLRDAALVAKADCLYVRQTQVRVLRRCMVAFMHSDLSEQRAVRHARRRRLRLAMGVLWGCTQRKLYQRKILARTDLWRRGNILRWTWQAWERLFQTRVRAQRAALRKPKRVSRASIVAKRGVDRQNVAVIPPVQALISPIAAQHSATTFATATATPSFSPSLSSTSPAHPTPVTAAVSVSPRQEQRHWPPLAHVDSPARASVPEYEHDKACEYENGDACMSDIDLNQSLSVAERLATAMVHHDTQVMRRALRFMLHRATTRLQLMQQSTETTETDTAETTRLRQSRDRVSAIMHHQRSVHKKVGEYFGRWRHSFQLSTSSGQRQSTLTLPSPSLLSPPQKELLPIAIQRERASVSARPESLELERVAVTAVAAPLLPKQEPEQEGVCAADEAAVSEELQELARHMAQVHAMELASRCFSHWRTLFRRKRHFAGTIKRQLHALVLSVASGFEQLQVEERLVIELNQARAKRTRERLYTAWKQHFHMLVYRRQSGYALHASKIHALAPTNAQHHSRHALMALTPVMITNIRTAVEYRRHSVIHGAFAMWRDQYMAKAMRIKPPPTPVAEEVTAQLPSSASSRRSSTSSTSSSSSCSSRSKKNEKRSGPSDPSTQRAKPPAKSDRPRREVAERFRRASSVASSSVASPPATVSPHVEVFVSEPPPSRALHVPPEPMTSPSPSSAQQPSELPPSLLDIANVSLGGLLDSTVDSEQEEMRSHTHTQSPARGPSSRRASSEPREGPTQQHTDTHARPAASVYGEPHANLYLTQAQVDGELLTELHSMGLHEDDIRYLIH